MIVQGWKCNPYAEQRLVGAELSCHVRAHFYVYSRDLRFLPTADLEETLEFMACVAHDDGLDAGTKMVVLDALNTFLSGEEQDGDSSYTSFQTQQELDAYCLSCGWQTK